MHLPDAPAMTRIVVTGSAGNLGRKAVRALVDVVGAEVVGIDTRPTNEPDVHSVVADLGTYDAAWVTHVAGADAVLHLAADPRPVASWAQVQHLNVDVSLHVLRAVEEQRVPRLAFASTNWVLGGHRFSTTPLTPTTPVRPINPYGYAKAATERDCVALHARTGADVVVMRLGWCQPGENRPGPHMAFGHWGQEMWLSNEDWAQAVVAACTHPWTGCEIVNVMSDNAGMRWDLTDTERVLGYRPRSDHTPRFSARSRLGERAARLRDGPLRRLVDAAGLGARW